MQQFKNNRFVDDVFILNENNVSQFIKKIGFLKKIKAAIPAPVEQLPHLAEGQVKHYSKKLFDIILSLTAIVLLSPVFVIIAAVIRVESRGPVLYCSPRVGRGYKVFKFYKFRTMEVGADSKVPEMFHLNQYICDKKSPLFLR